MFSHHRLVPNKSNNVTILDNQLPTTKQNQVSHLGMRRNGLETVVWKREMCSKCKKSSVLIEMVVHFLNRRLHSEMRRHGSSLRSYGDCQETQKERRQNISYNKFREKSSDSYHPRSQCRTGNVQQSVRYTVVPLRIHKETLACWLKLFEMSKLAQNGIFLFSFEFENALGASTVNRAGHCEKVTADSSR